MVINYITNLDVKEFSGGWSGMNRLVYDQLSLRFTVNLIDKINPPYFFGDRIVSKTFRIAGMEGVFPALTENRLNYISKNISAKINLDASFNFFHGATPWLNFASSLPYAIYLDACFATYISVYHKGEKFNSRQLKRLYEKEAKFLANAEAAFFSSQWALDDAAKNYDVAGQNFYVAGLGGALDVEIDSKRTKEPYFLFAGLDFSGKGGDIVVEAFEEVSKDFPSFYLKIVGQKPPEKYLLHSKIEYVGFIDKGDPEGSKKLNSLFVNAYSFILPTSRDITPLVLVEAGSVGCPAITTNSFGIPEIVLDNETGLLLDAKQPLREQLVKAMKEMIQNKSLHQKLSSNSREYIRNNFTWDRTGEIICNKLLESFL